MNSSDDDFKLSSYVSTNGLVCRKCKQPLDTATTITMLCTSCKRKEWAAKQQKAFQEKYGVTNPMKVPQFVNKIQQTMQKRYGANCAMNVPKFRAKMENTNKERYGTAYYVNSPDYLNITSKQGCKSKINQKFGDLLKTNNIDYSVEEVRDDKRFDIYLTASRTFIEIDPTYTHNTAGNHWNKQGQEKNKQLEKTLIAEKYNYRCIHVFDWDNWNDIIDLIKPKTRIFARKCTIKELSSKDNFNEFINANHIQQNCKGTKVAIGLYYNTELVQVITFGKPRYNANYQWELLRLCARKDLNVIGGASKLFHYATTILKLNSIISYCDRSKFTGAVYTNIGMKLERYTVPQEIWSKGNQKITSSLLRQRGYDQLFGTNYGKGTSNEELMIQNGWLPVYDCGQAVYTYGPALSLMKDENTENNGLNYTEILNKLDHKRKEKICAYCGESFIPNSGQQIYCKRPHYMKCPVCGKDYLVTNNEKLKFPPVACSYACRQAKARQTNLEKYGVESYTSSPEMQNKSKETMLKKYGVEYALASKEIQEKSKQTLLEKYGVDNIKKVDSINGQSLMKRHENWVAKVHTLLPFKPEQKLNQPNMKTLEESKMSIYILTEKVSVEFLAKYGHRIKPTFSKIHLSVGYVFDKTVYQVIRFERVKDAIILADFGIKDGYMNPHGYTKLMQFTASTRNIDEFTAEVPRKIATPQLVDSLCLTKVADGDYKVFWKIEDGSLQELTNRDNIEEMKRKYEYITSDYLDEYVFDASKLGLTSANDSIFIQTTQQFNM